MKQIVKKRYWAVITWPESMNQDWYDELVSSGLQATFILHDKDIDENGEPKKPHYHFILAWENPTTYKNVCEVVDRIFGSSLLPKPIESLKGKYEYHIHKNDKDKYQYDERERCFVNGFNIVNFLSRTESYDPIDIINIIHKHIDDNNVLHFSELASHFRANGQKFEYETLVKYTFYFTEITKNKTYIFHRQAELKEQIREYLKDEYMHIDDVIELLEKEKQKYTK
ncbi:plasmid replication protein (plasmid) [Mycoplasma mycoides subsp. capri LC str. 95010]|uniref:Plasmid replication protein n=1 Tax=Mycoplasma mycoides subsp. capri LC str. 95010 TaxID=862259 RepID=G2XMY3_MYCML|nr:Rep family protein [Mycoplasma mycoides]CCD32483.1 plasmid replication protein [Mycoplasma mycoides subsp. capri LC str. 95010]